MPVINKKMKNHKRSKRNFEQKQENHGKKLKLNLTSVVARRKRGIFCTTFKLFLGLCKHLEILIFNMAFKNNPNMGFNPGR